MFVVEDVLSLVMVVKSFVSVTFDRETNFAVDPRLGASQANATLIITLNQSGTIVTIGGFSTILEPFAPHIVVYLLQQGS